VRTPHTILTDAEGFFDLDLPAGGYEVVIDATGFVSQRRQVEIADDEVTVLNADLRQAAEP
jgi:hypothetical protein